MTRPEITALIVTGLLLVSTFAVSLIPAPQRSEAEPEPLRTHIRGVIQLDRRSSSRALVVGYNYYLLESYAEQNGQTIEIEAARRNGSYIDSLKAGRVDMVAIAWSDSLSVDSVLVSRPVDSLTVWLMRADDTRDMEDFDSWLGEWEQSEDHERVRDSFLNRYDVFRSRQREVLSPYDSLIRASADSIDVDWRLLAAIIYKESRFHIEARSYRGASGLMQMMPSTAEHYGVSDPLDPESNIQAGATFFGRLVRRYRKVAADEDERYKFALAAYNAGMGRVDDILNLARLRDKDSGYWEDAVQVLPEMREESVMDTGVVKLGTFKGSETTRYVNDVMAIYREFCRICPD